MNKKQCSSCHWWLRDGDGKHWGRCRWGQQHLATPYVDPDITMRGDEGSDCVMWKQVGQDNAEDH